MNVVTAARPPAEDRKLLAAILDSLAEGVLAFDAKDRLALWNSRMRALLPAYEETLEVGQPLDEVMGRLDGVADGRLVRQWRRGVRDLLILTLRHRDGATEATVEFPQGAEAGEIAWAWECDADGGMTVVSGGGNSLSADMLRRFLGDSGMWEDHLAVLRTRQPFRDVHISLRGGRRIHHFLISGQPFFDQSGNFRGYRGNGREAVPHDADRHQVGQWLFDAVEYLPHGVALFDADDCLVLCNERFRQSLPDVIAQLVRGARFVDICRLAAERMASEPADIQRWIDERLECHRLGLTHERRCPDGRWLLVEDKRLHNGTTVVTHTDITELKRREQAVRESEARFRAVFQYAAIGIAVVQPGGRIVQANPTLATMLGYTTDELAQMRYADLVEGDTLEREARLARQLVDGEIEFYQQETRYIRKDKQLVWARLTVSIVRRDGPHRFSIAMIENIDERKQAETTLSIFRAVAEASDEAIAILGADGAPLYVNSAHERLFGRDLAEAARIGYRRHYTEESQQLLRRQVVPALFRGDNWEGVLDARAADGHTFPLWQRAGAVRGPDNRPQFYFAFMHDHTDQQRIQDKLRAAKEAAEQANVAKTRYLAIASHDLRQPLQALSMFVAVLSSRPHPPDDAKLIARIEDSVNAVETLLNGLLDVSKLEAGLVEPMPAAFNIGSLLNRLAVEFEPQIGKAGLKFRVVGSRAMVQSDPALLERILRNFLNNATHYTKTGRILFGCRRRGNALRIVVCDTGIGIPQKEIKMIFREFHQLGDRGRERHQGLGLGLAIVDRLARLLGHPIDVWSVEGKGSMFSVEVPLANQPETAGPPQQLTLNMARRNALILVIDDEPDVLESTRLLLESWGHKVLPAHDCDTALRQVRRPARIPDLILADYRLQNGATGGQAISRIRARLKAAVPAIVLTGDTAPDRLRLAQAGGHRLLHKPVQPATLRQLIDQVLNGAATVAPTIR